MLAAFLWKFIAKQRWGFLGVLLNIFIWPLDILVWPFLFKKIIDILTKYDLARSEALGALVNPIISIIILALVVEFGFRFSGFVSAKVFPQLEANIRMDMFSHIQCHSPNYFNQRFAGGLANKITDMTSNVSVILMQLMTVFAPTVLACLFALVFMAYVNTTVTVLLGIWIFLHFMVCFIYSKKCNKLEGIHAEARGKLIGKIVDSFSNNFAVNLYYRFKQERQYISPFQSLEEQTNVVSKMSIEWMKLWMGLFTFLFGSVGIYGYMIYLWLHNGISTGEVVQIYNTLWNVCMVMWMSGMMLPQVFQSVGIANQALRVMKDPQDVKDVEGSSPLVVTRGEIVFDDVSFQYKEKKLFENKNVHIKGGEKIGLVGFSGAGKSTFVSLILRLNTVFSGEIRIDGQNIDKVTLESLRKQIALIPQDPMLFHRTILENIRFGKPDATDEEVFKASKMAHCDVFVDKLPGKYDSKVGERGANLSGGERQRITIARAILADAPILILDEATSALDSITERYIQDSLDWLMKERTTIVIAHRLSTLVGMDRILVFDKGKIVEEGTHLELLALQGHYWKMWTMQAGGFLPSGSL